MAILPERDKQIYPEIKRVGDNVIGIPTQCVQSKHVHRTNPQVCANIALKINSKLGGINHVIDPGEKSPVFRESVIIFGTDLTHPSLNENGIPSIAAVAASMDANATKYCARVRAQNHRNGKGAQEIINDLAEIVKELLIEFYRARSSSTGTESVRVSLTKFLLMRCGLYNRPVLCLKKIIARESLLLWFRSAIIRDCFVKTNEMKLAKQGMFLLVQQRTAVSHIRTNSTFICAVIMESSRRLQQLTYQLCHVYARCTRSVFMPAPAYYAHLVAFRARHHVTGNGSIDLVKSAKAIEVNAKMKGPMYFT